MKNKIFSRVASSVSMVSRILKNKFKPAEKIIENGNEVQWGDIPKEVAAALRNQKLVSPKIKK